MVVVVVMIEEPPDGFYPASASASSRTGMLFPISPHVKCALLYRESSSACIRLMPQVMLPEYGLYTWPSSFVLARFLWRHRARYLRRRAIRGTPSCDRPTRVLELGAGTALPAGAHTRSLLSSTRALFMG